MTELEALQQAIKIVGSQAKLARALGYTQPSVSDWVNRIGKAPAEAVIPIECLTNGQISRHSLRPDIYPIETSGIPSFVANCSM